MIKLLKLEFIILVVTLSACVVSPGYYDGYYDGGPGPAPHNSYYGYGPAYYPWDTGVGVDIFNGYGHGGSYGRGRGFGRGGGGRR